MKYTNIIFYVSGFILFKIIIFYLGAEVTARMKAINAIIIDIKVCCRISTIT